MVKQRSFKPWNPDRYRGDPPNITMNTNISKINSADNDQIQRLLDDSSSFRQIFQALRVCENANNFYSLKRRLQKLDLTKFNANKLVAARNRQTKLNFCKDILIENSKVRIKKNYKSKLIREGLLKYECQICKNIGEFNGKPLVLQLDHINGVNNDNRIENLRFLCPNCHSQSDTFCGRRTKIDSKYFCATCKCSTKGRGKYCRSCASKLRPSGING